jgi:hypothetical protein
MPAMLMHELAEWALAPTRRCEAQPASCPVRMEATALVCVSIGGHLLFARLQQFAAGYYGPIVAFATPVVAARTMPGGQPCGDTAVPARYVDRA